MPSLDSRCDLPIFQPWIHDEEYVGLSRRLVHIVENLLNVMKESELDFGRDSPLQCRNLPHPGIVKVTPVTLLHLNFETLKITMNYLGGRTPGSRHHTDDESTRPFPATKPVSQVPSQQACDENRLTEKSTTSIDDNVDLWAKTFVPQAAVNGVADLLDEKVLDMLPGFWTGFSVHWAVDRAAFVQRDQVVVTEEAQKPGEE
jgi:hypothetical protein